MKFFFALTFLFILIMILKPQCSKKQVDTDCRAVCEDTGYDYKDKIQTGFFTYTCYCKNWPRSPVQVYPQR